MRWLWLFLVPALALGQSHEILRPTADVDGASQSFVATQCPGNSFGAPSMPNAYDAGGLTTFSLDTLTVPATVLANKKSARLFKTWGTTSNAYSALSLNVNSASGGQGASLIGNAYLAYSLNGGSTWTAIQNDSTGAGWLQQTNTFTLSTSQDLTKLEVAFCLDTAGDGTNAGTENITLWDIWTDGSYTPATPTPTPNLPNQTPAIPHPVITSKLLSSDKSFALFSRILKIGHLIIGP